MAWYRFLRLWIVFTLGQHAVAAGTDTAWAIPFNNTKGVGPDGPWRVITVGVGFPDQYCDFYPGGQGPTVLIDKEVCQDQTVSCPSPLPLTYDRALSNNRLASTAPESIGPEQWDAERSKALNLTGNARYVSERIFVREPGETFFADNTSVLLSSSLTVNYPGRVQVPLTVGLLSLGLPSDTMQVKAADGSSLTLWTLLGNFARSDRISSRSWGLQIGSVTQGINGSLYFGGYDRSRILGDVGLFSGPTVRLAEIQVGTAQGRSPFPAPGANLLNEVRGVTLDASVPYMYLSADVCTSIASQLPVSFDADLGLYIWDTQNATYTEIISSPSYLSFRFLDSSDSDLQIRVPFALLNLTLESPLVAQPTPYFPCRPLTAGENSRVILGRAFLQAAFIGQNWESGKYFLAQAPGPGLQRGPEVKRIIGYEEKLLPPLNPPSWESTWESVLRPLSDSTSSSDEPLASQTSSSSPSLSPGARAGIGIGASAAAIAVIAGVLLFFRRRRAHAPASEPSPLPADEKAEPAYSEMSAMEMAHEAPAGNTAVELPTARDYKP